MRASTICGSDIRAIYREHVQGDPAEMYQGVVAGHEPAGEVVAVGRDALRLKVGDRVCVYHISGCGQCDDCVRGYQISCSSPRRAAYGWQRDGGHADLILAQERDCIVLSDFVTFLDGACVACGFGTAYEGPLALRSAVGMPLAVVLGPSAPPPACSAASSAPCRGWVWIPAGAAELAVRLGAADAAFAPGGRRPRSCQRRGPSRSTARGASPVAVPHRRVRSADELSCRRGQRLGCAEVSPALIRPRSRFWALGSVWAQLRELVSRLPVWNLHPEVIVTDTFPIADADVAYQLADAGQSGKIALVP
jgi:hypothetical protein